MTARGLCLALALLTVLGAACAPAAGAPTSAPPKAAAPPAGAAASSSGNAPAASAPAPGSAAPTAVPAPDPVRLGLIGPQAGYWAIYAAEAQGFFARERVANDVTYTRSPATSAQLLATGDVDLTVGTADTSAIAISKGADFVIVAGTQADALFTLIVQPSVQTYADLRGKLVAINNLRDGPTTMLRRLLRANNMREDDVEFIAVGGTPERFTALTSGNVAGAMLAQPQDLMAQASGHRRLAIATEILPDFQNFNVVTSRPWARANDDRLVRWIRAIIAGCAWLNDPANRAEAVRVLVDATQTPEDIAQRTWALYFEERAGKAIPPDGGINQAGLRNVLALADESGNFEGTPPPSLDRIVDLSYWERARH